MNRSPIGFRQGRWVSAVSLILAACVAGDRHTVLEPDYAIRDGAHSGGTAGFYFLPPMVSQPSFTGVFDGDIAAVNPIVAICDVTDAPVTDCGGATPALRVFTTTGTPPITVDTDKYKVNWDTKEGPFAAGRTFRVHVRARTPSRELGFADILLTTEPGKAKNLGDGETILLSDGRTLPIHFRIEQGAGPANEAPVVDAGPDQTITQTTAALAGTITDDGQPSGTLTTIWSQVSGPSTVTFGDPSAAATTATLSAPGTYVLRLSANDGELTGEDEVIIGVGGGTVNWTGAAGDFDWNTADNWDVQRVPGPFDDVIIASAGEQPVTHGAGANTIQSLTVDGASAITLTGGTLTVSGAAAITSGVLRLAGGTLAKATVTGTGAVLAIDASGTLDGVTLASDVTLTVPSASTLTLVNGLTLEGRVELTGGQSFNVFARVDAVGTQTIGGSGEIVLAGDERFNAVAATTPATTLTLGPSLTVRGGGQLGLATSQLVNQGNIRLGALAPTFSMVANLANTGTLAVTNGASVTLSGAWSSGGGTVQLADATVNLGGTFTTAGLGAWQRTNGTVNVTGILTNTGETLDVDAIGIGVVRLFSGTIVGGTVVPGSVSTSPLLTSGIATLDGVTLATGLIMTLQSSALLTLRNGLMLNGRLVVTGNASQPSAPGSIVRAEGSQTLGGSGEVVLDIVGQTNSITGTAGTTLTLGPLLAVRGTGFVGSGLGGGVINHGTIRADVSGRALSLSNLANHGTIAAMGGTTLNISGLWTNAGATVQLADATINLAATVTTADLGTWQRTNGTVNLVAAGTLTNTGATLDVDASGMGVLQLSGGTILGGTIVPGTVTTTPVVMPAGGTGTLDGVRLPAGLTFTVPAGATLTLRNGLTLDGQVSLVSTTASTARVTAVGTQTLGGTGEIVLGGAANRSSLAGSTGITLTLGPSLTVSGTGVVSAGTGVSQLVNQGTIRADVSGQTLTVLKSANQGTVAALNGATLAFAGVGESWTNGGTIQVTDATVNLGGTFSPAGLGIWQRTNGTVNLVSQAILANTGGILDVDASGLGQLRLAGGTIQGGTVVPGSVTTTPLVMAPGTSSLDGVTLPTGLTLTVPGGSTLRLVNGLTLDGNLILTGAVGASATVNTVQAQTIGGSGDIAMAGSGAQNFLRASASGALTIGPAITVHGAGTVGLNPNQLVNHGTIRADAAGGMTVTGFTNLGTLAVTSEQSLTLTGVWTSAGGTVELVDGTVNLGGSFTPAILGTWQRTNGTVNLTGTLTNTGGTLDVDANGMGALRLSGGTLVGGTVVVGSATTAPPLVLASGVSTLDAVTLASGVTLTVPSGATLTLRNGLTLDGNLILAGLPGGPTTRANVTAAGTQTVGGTGAVFLGAATEQGLFAGTPGTILTLGSSLTIRGAGIVGLAGTQLVNLGTIVPDVPGQALRGNNLTNNGVIKVPATGLAQMAGTFTNGAGGTVNIEIGGAAIGQFGRITVTGPGATGPPNLAGTLNASLVGGFVPAAGDRFRFMTFSALNGAFTTTVLPPGFVLETHATDLELVAP